MYFTGESFSKCKATDRKGVFLILRKWYSFERSRSILQIVSENVFYEDEHIQILKSFVDSNAFYYVLKCSSKV